MIIRSEVRNRFTILDNRMLEDRRLSWAARGLLAYLLSKPNGWNVIQQHLIAHSPGGRRIVEKVLRELETNGYIVRSQQERRGGGRWDSIDTVVHEIPTPMYKTANGSDQGERTKPQVGTDVHLPHAVDVPLVSTEVVKTEDCGGKTDEVVGGQLTQIEDSQSSATASQSMPRASGLTVSERTAAAIRNRTRDRDEAAVLIADEYGHVDPFEVMAAYDRLATLAMVAS